jgi:hypothetical protein
VLSLLTAVNQESPSVEGAREEGTVRAPELRCRLAMKVSCLKMAKPRFDASQGYTIFCIFPGAFRDLRRWSGIGDTTQPLNTPVSERLVRQRTNRECAEL